MEWKILVNNLVFSHFSSEWMVCWMSWNKKIKETQRNFLCKRYIQKLADCWSNNSTQKTYIRDREQRQSDQWNNGELMSTFSLYNKNDLFFPLFRLQIVVTTSLSLISTLYDSVWFVRRREMCTLFFQWNQSDTWRNRKRNEMKTSLYLLSRPTIISIKSSDAKKRELLGEVN